MLLLDCCEQLNVTVKEDRGLGAAPYRQHLCDLHCLLKLFSIVPLLALIVASLTLIECAHVIGKFISWIIIPCPYSDASYNTVLRLKAVRQL